MSRSLRIGTRGSALAIQQTQIVVDALHAAWPDLSVDVMHIRTTGDRIQDVPLAKIGDKGLFVKEIEEALLDSRIDWAVHSVKDLPSELPNGLERRHAGGPQRPPRCPRCTPWVDIWRRCPRTP